MSGNQALNTNSVVGEPADLAITDHGSDWYWTVCALMALSTFAFMGLSYTKKKTHRLFHYITAGITLVASIAYYAMAAGLGQTPIQVEFPRPDVMDVAAAGTRQIFWVRFVDYAITTPLILTNLFLTSSIPRPTMLATLLADELMVVCYLAGALTKTSYKWGFFVFGLFAYFFVVYSLMFDGRRYASALGGAANKTFLTCAGLTVFIWLLYPIAWGVSVGGNVIHPDSEAIFFGILDIVSKIVVGFLLVFGHKNIDPAELGLHIREHTTLPRHEKNNTRRDHRDRIGHNGSSKGIFGHRNKAMGGNDDVEDYHHGPHNHHHGMSDRRGMRSNNEITNYQDGTHDRHHGLSDQRDATMARHSKVTDQGDEEGNYRNITTNRNNDVGDYREKPTEHRDGMSNYHGTTMNRDNERSAHRNRANDQFNEDFDHYDREPKYHRRKPKPSGGGIFNLFRKNNHYDDSNQAYRARDRSLNRDDSYRRGQSPDRDGHYGRERGPVQDYNRRDRRSRSRGEYDRREHSPLRDEYRTGHRSPARGGYRWGDRSPQRGDGQHHDVRRSYPEDSRRSFPKVGSHPDGHRSFPGGENYGDGRRALLGGEAHGDGRRSAPMENYDRDDRYNHDAGNHAEDSRATAAVESHQQNIRSIPGGGSMAGDRRPVPGAEHNRQALRPDPGNQGQGETVRPGGENQLDNRQSSGEHRPDMRNVSGEFQRTQISNTNSANDGTFSGPERS